MYQNFGVSLDLVLPNQPVETDAPKSGAPLTSRRYAM
jgi:hypothetical protein